MFVPASKDQAKLIAKRIKRALEDNLVGEIPMSGALDLVAAMFEFPEPFERMVHKTRNMEPSPWDSDCPLFEVARRRHHHIGVLQALGVQEKVAEIIIDDVRPTERPGAREPEHTPACNSIPVDQFLAAARQQLAQGNWEQASNFAGRGALRVEPQERGPFLDVILTAASHSDVVIFQIAQDKLTGDLFPKDVGAGKRELAALLDRDPPADLKMVVLSVLGEIAMGLYGGPQKFDEAIALYAAASKAGNADASYNAALICFKDLDEPVRAAPFLEDGVKSGNIRAISMLGRLILINKVEGSKTRALSLLQAAAAAGDRDAILALPHAERAVAT